jgi:DNA-binding SARP family transcriptional activator
MQFKVLGPLEIRDGDRPVTCKGSKQRVLLGVLLLHANEIVSSDRLIGALWGERPPGTAAKALQVHVSQLRKLLEPERVPGGSSQILITRPPGYELRVEAGQLDLHRFEQAVREARLAAEAGRARQAANTLRGALALWRGPPLADLSFEDFLQTDITRLEELRLAALEDRLDADLVLGRHSEVIGELESLASQHPLRERLRAQLMLALYRSGRQAEALGVYRDTRHVLVEEVGIEPGPDLKDLERAILAQDPTLALHETSRMESPEQPPAAEGLVGRGKEMAELLPLLDVALTGSGGLVLIAGEPGIGKSRLSEALAGYAQERGARVLVGRCWEAGGAPAYWPWVQAVRTYLRESDVETLRSQIGRGGAELATLLPELRDLLPGLPPAPQAELEGARFRLFESVVSFLVSAAASQPLVLVLDDLHAADASSLLLLRFVVDELARGSIMIVGCYRDTEVGPDLAEALPELTRRTVVRRISLTGLSRSDTARLLELTTGHVPPVELAAQVHADTEGNPLFAGEVGRLLASEGRLGESEDVQQSLPIPEGVREAIGRRLRGHSDGCRELLTLASVIGREFDLDALGLVSGLDERGLSEALAEAASARLVGDVPGASGRLRFSHVLIRNTLYEDLAAPRRLRLHRAFGDALEALHAGNLESHLAELAHHYLEAGTAGAEKAIRYAAGAGDRAASQLAYEEAARQYRSALRLLEAVGPGDDTKSCELLLSLGEVLSRAGDTPEAKAAFRRAAAIAEASGRPDQLARAALGYGGRFAWARAGSDAAYVPLLERALEAVGEEDSTVRVRLLARLSFAVRDQPTRDRRLRLAGEALDVARRLGDPSTLAHALEGWPMAEGPDNLERRLSGGDELISLAEEIGDNERAYMGHEYRLHAVWTVGDRAGVDVELDSLSRLADELRQPSQRWHVSSMQTMLALMEGRFEQAEELISRTLTLGERAESWNAVVSQRVQLFVLRREQGRLGELEDLVSRSVHQYPALLRFRGVLAHLYAGLGREQDARAAFDALLSRDLGKEHLDEEWLFGMSLLPDVCAFLGDAGAAARLYEILLPYEHLYAEAPVEAAFGSVARGLGVLATTLRRFDHAERHFDTAMETERRMGARPWLAHTQHDCAAMLLARNEPGDREPALELVGRALEAYRSLGMAGYTYEAERLESALGAAPAR